jgi:hypothetical protein
MARTAFQFHFTYLAMWLQNDPHRMLNKDKTGRGLWLRCLFYFGVSFPQHTVVLNPFFPPYLAIRWIHSSILLFMQECECRIILITCWMRIMEGSVTSWMHDQGPEMIHVYVDYVKGGTLRGRAHFYIKIPQV